MPGDRFLQALRNAASELTAAFKDSKLFQHRGNIGTFREQIIEKLMRPVLPPRYGMGTGEVFAEDGTGSRQIDIVVFDALFSNVLFRNEKLSLFPVSSVYGAIEVKSRLDKDELGAAIDNIRSLKALRRPDSDGQDLLPDLRLNLGAGLQGSTIKRNHYIGVVVGFESVGEKTLQAHLHEQFQSSNDAGMTMPEGIFCIHSGLTFLRMARDGTVGRPARFGEAAVGYMMLRTNDDTVALMALLLNALVADVRLRAPSYDRYLLNVIQGSMGGATWFG